MSFQHHGEGMSEQSRKLFENEKAAMERLVDQINNRAKRTWSDGRVSEDDDGDIAFSIGPHPDRELVVLDFGKQVEWLGMPPQQAVELAQALIKHARAISSSPLKIQLH